jgi:hypothetical protein
LENKFHQFSENAKMADLNAFFILLFLPLILLLLLHRNYIPRLLDCVLRRTPPGPFSWPFFGALNIDASQPWETLADWGRKYAGFYTTFIGTEFTLVLTDIEVIKLAMNNPGFDGRPVNMISRRLYKNKGSTIPASKGSKGSKGSKISIFFGN